MAANKVWERKKSRGNCLSLPAIVAIVDLDIDPGEHCLFGFVYVSLHGLSSGQMDNRI